VLQVSFSGDPDRYVAGQLSVLRSEGMAQRAAGLLGLSSADVADAVRFEQEPLTDVVSIIAATSDPERSQAIADAYVEAYLAQLNSQLTASQTPELERLEEQIAEVVAQIDDVDTRLEAVMAPFLDRNPIPSPEQVAPALVSEKTLLLNEVAELEASRAELRRGLRVATEVVQDATLPTDPVESPYRPLLGAGVLLGAFVGLVAAAVVARLSPTVLGDEQAEDILGHPVVGSFPVLPDVTSRRRAVIDVPAPSAAAAIESLCVRVEAAARAGESLAVIVTSTQARAGTTTTAAALARSFAGPRTRVLLVDADLRQPELSTLFAYKARRAPVSVGGGERPPPGEDDVFSATGVQNLAVTSVGLLTELSLEADTGHRAGRGTDPDHLLAIARSQADVVVFDGGPLMSATSTVQLTRRCDAVVVAMPDRQPVRALETIATELRDQRHVLPVWTPVGRRRQTATRPAVAAP
jgi:Mrp family chromosome partitioning ATPase